MAISRYAQGFVEAEGDYGGEMGRQQVQAVYVLFVDEEEERLFSPTGENSELAWADPSEIGHPNIAPYGLDCFEINIRVLATAVDLAIPPLRELFE